MELKFKDLIVKSEAELKTMSDEQLLTLKHENEKIQAENQALLSEFISKSVKEAEELKSALKEQGKELEGLKEEGSTSIKAQLKKKEESILKGIEMFKSNGKGKFKLDVKDVTSTSISNSTASQRISGVGKEPHRQIFMSQLFKNVTMTENYNGASVSYVDQDTLNRNAENVAECVAPTGSDITWVESKTDIKKIADTLKVCKDALENYQFMEAEVDQFLMENMLLKLDEQLLLGDGVGNNLTGVDAVAQTWSVAAGSPIEGLALQIKFPTIFDVITTGMTQITNSGGGSKAFYSPNAILMNPTDVRKLSLEKDENGQYLIPNHLSSNGIQIEGIPVISSPLVAVNTLYIGDFTKGTIYTLREIEMEMANQHESDFTADLLTLKATLRKALVIKNQHANAFLKVTDIDAAKIALTKP